MAITAQWSVLSQEVAKSLPPSRRSVAFFHTGWRAQSGPRSLLCAFGWSQGLGGAEMIVKPIRSSKKARTKGGSATYAFTLGRYILRADAADLKRLEAFEKGDAHAYPGDVGHYILADNESVVSFGGRHLPSLDENKNAAADRIVDDFKRMVEDSGHVNCVEHWVISRRADETGSDENFEITISELIAGLGFNNCPVLWGVHGDTDNRHVHLAIASFDAKTAERVPKHPWSVKAAHAAIAVAHEKIGSQPEPNATFRIRGGAIFVSATGEYAGEVSDPLSWCRTPLKRKAQSKLAAKIKLDAPSLRYEEETGLMSRKRIATEIALPIFEQIAEELKSDEPSDSKIGKLILGLAAAGICLERTRKGAYLLINGKPVQASINRNWSQRKIEKEFGKIPDKPLYGRDAIIERELFEQADPRRQYYFWKRHHDSKVKAVKQHYARQELKAFVKRCSGTLEKAVAACAFPDFAEWKSEGANLREPSEIFTEVLGIRTFSAGCVNKAVPLEPIDYPELRTRSFSKRSEAFIKPAGEKTIIPVMTDLGKEIFIGRANDEAAVRMAIIVLSLRGATAIEAFNLSKPEKKAARLTAQRMKIEIVFNDREKRIHYSSPFATKSKVLNEHDIPSAKSDHAPNPEPITASQVTDRTPDDAAARECTENLREADAFKVDKELDLQEGSRETADKLSKADGQTGGVIRSGSQRSSQNIRNESSSAETKAPKPDDGPLYIDEKGRVRMRPLPDRPESEMAELMKPKVLGEDPETKRQAAEEAQRKIEREKLARPMNALDSYDLHDYQSRAKRNKPIVPLAHGLNPKIDLWIDKDRENNLDARRIAAGAILQDAAVMLIIEDMEPSTRARFDRDFEAFKEKRRQNYLANQQSLGMGH